MSPLPPITTIFMSNLLVRNPLSGLLMPVRRFRIRLKSGENCPRSFRESLQWHEDGSAFVLDQEHYEFCWLGGACIPANDMLVVGAFIKRLSGCQRHLLPTLHLHDNGTL